MDIDNYVVKGGMEEGLVGGGQGGRWETPVTLATAKQRTEFRSQ